jgi:hypothetical protein
MGRDESHEIVNYCEFQKHLILLLVVITPPSIELIRVLNNSIKRT